MRSRAGVGDKGRDCGRAATAETHGFATRLRLAGHFVVSNAVPCSTGRVPKRPYRSIREGVSMACRRARATATVAYPVLARKRGTRDEMLVIDT